MSTQLQIRSFEESLTAFRTDKAQRTSQSAHGATYLLTSSQDKGSRFSGKYVKGDSRSQASLRREAETLSRLQHQDGRYVASIQGYYESGKHSMLVTDLVPGNELLRSIAKSNLTTEIAIGFVTQIVNALNYIHSKNIVHLDLNPQNILITGRNKDVIKLSGFEHSKELNPDGSVYVRHPGTYGFTAPEILRVHMAFKTTDFFSLGVITFMMLSGGHEPFTAESNISTVRRTLGHTPDYELLQESQDSDCVHFIAALLEKEPHKRLHGPATLGHPWLKPSSDADNQSRMVITTRLKSYYARRRWHQAIGAVKFMVKIGGVPTAETPLDAFLN